MFINFLISLQRNKLEVVGDPLQVCIMQERKKFQSVHLGTQGKGLGSMSRLTDNYTFQTLS